MKNYIKLSILACSLAGMTACDMDAPTISSLDETQVFATYSLAEAEVMSIHVSFGETNSYRGRFLPYYGLNTDIEWINTPDASKATDEKQSLGNWNTLANNTQMNTDNNAYAKFYEGIERANLAIKNLRIYGDIENRPDMAQLLGEALTLRAVLYNDLIKGWGDVPARFEPNSPENIYLPRTNRDIIYKQLLADLKEAEDYCYWPNENAITKTTERINKSFVKGLRARLALYAGGYGQRGDGYRLSKDPDLAPEKMFQIAKEECIDVINAGYNTLGEFKDNFVRLCQDNVTAGAESLWEIPFSDGRGRVCYTFGVKHNAKDQYTQQNNGGVNGPVPTLFYKYDVEDVRRDITCVPYDWSEDLENGYAHQQLRGNNKWCFGKLRYEWMNRIVTSTNDDGINWQYMRLADVYLMAAEAVNELDGPSAAAQYLKPILDRALPAAKVTAYMNNIVGDKNAFRNAIIDQRAFEFAGEMLRKADLIRWGIVDEKMEEAKADLRAMNAKSGIYSDLPDKLYYVRVDDDKSKDGAYKEAILIYGLNHGDTDSSSDRFAYFAEKLGITADEAEELYNAEGGSKGWILSSGTPVVTDVMIDGLVVVKPSEHTVWPIWQTFINTSNGMLDQNLLSD